MFIDRFSAGLDDLTRKQQADHIAVLRVLARTGRFSCFEASDNDVIAKTMTFLCHSSLMTTKDAGFPWTSVKLTEAGIEAIAYKADK